MHHVSQLRPSVRAAKQRLAEGREKFRQLHDQGSLGIQVCAHLTDLWDSVVLDLYESALADFGRVDASRLQSHVALVPFGGYGRRDVAPYSDVDLMLLHTPRSTQIVAPLARRLMVDLCDVGLDVGFNVRTPSQACALARVDATIFTSLVEARFLAGNERVFAGFEKRFRQQARRQTRRLIGSIQKARRGEQVQYGDTEYLLEPNVKRTRGGLRDLHLLRWIGFARYGEAEPDSLRRLGVLSAQDQSKLRLASEFLLRLRNELHFHAGRAYDVLGKAEQLRLAEDYGYVGTDGVLPVEQFMQDYFRHTSQVSHLVAHLVDRAKPRSLASLVLETVFSRSVGGNWHIGPRHISVTRRGLARLTSDVAQVLRLMELANLSNKWIAPATWAAIRQAMADREGLEITDEVVKRFLSLLSQPTRLGDLLRRLHQLGTLEKIVPGMAHANCLLQFNEYHKYTVDEHCLQAVQRATEFQTDPGPLGEVYRGIKRKRTLHLALLLHDLGKGFVEDHSDVGLRLARESSRRFRLPDREAGELDFLVHKHLLMAHLAFRRDTSDESVVIRFAMEVGTPELLNMLYIMTCADLAAVGPGVLNHWKIEVLTELHVRALRYLIGDAPALDSPQHLEARRDEIRRLCTRHQSPEWFDRQIQALPPTYLQGEDPGEVAGFLRHLQGLDSMSAVVWARYLKDRNAVQFTVGAYDQLTPGIFHKLTGALTSQGLEILAADIHTLEDGLVLDRFFVHDPDYSGPPPGDRLQKVRECLVGALTTPATSAPTFRRMWRAGSNQSAAKRSLLPTRVLVDNENSESHTIIDVFAHDRRGLLYTITRTLFELGTSVWVAKIGTYMDQVVDVFYVTDAEGDKIVEEGTLQGIRSRLLEAIEEVNAD